MVLAAVNQLNCSYLGVEKVVNEPIVVGRSMGDFFGHLTSLSDKYFGGSDVKNKLINFDICKFYRFVLCWFFFDKTWDTQFLVSYDFNRATPG